MYIDEKAVFSMVKGVQKIQKKKIGKKISHNS